MPERSRRFLRTSPLWLHALLVGAFGLSLASGDATAQAGRPRTAAKPPAATQPIAPVDGSLLLVGKGEVPDYLLDAFLHLSGGYHAKIAVIRSAGKARSVARWHERGAQSVLVLGKKAASNDAMTTALLEADGVWFEDAAVHLQQHALFHKLLRNVLRRGGVVGGHDEGALAIAERHARTGLLPHSKIQLTKDKTGTLRELERLVQGGDGTVSWQIPARTALVVHHGRRIAALGEGVVRGLVAKTEGHGARTCEIQTIDAFDPGDSLDYEVDLLSWLRSARDRTLPPFPPQKMAPVHLAKGALVLSGGDGVPSPTWRKFIAAAGGKDALIVCIPTAGGVEKGRTPRSYSARQLRDHGCTNVVVLHSNDPHRCNDDRRLLQPLETAGGVWIDGGRTYLVMDIYEHTRAHQLMRDVLARGGVVGGSSAGCQVAGDFLVRGNPRSNKALTHEGYLRGLGFLDGVILDAHFRQRNREQAFAELLGRYPQMLGIGVDEGTAVYIEGGVAEVLGRASVSFYDGAKPPVLVQDGGKYDLGKKRAL